MVAQDGSGMVRGTEKKVSVSVSVSVTENYGAATSPLHDPEFDKSNSDHAHPSPEKQVSHGRGDGENDAHEKSSDVCADQSTEKTYGFSHNGNSTTAGGDACATRDNDAAGNGNGEIFRSALDDSLGNATPLQNFWNRLEALLDERPGACYIIGGYGNDKFAKLMRSPDTSIAGHGRTITEALSSLLDCAQAEQTAIGLAKAGEF